MFHKPVKLKYNAGTSLELTFRSGEVKRFDMAKMFPKYPALEALKGRRLFISGKLSGYGIIWNDELDIEAETVYEEGELIKIIDIAADADMCDALIAARAGAGLSQTELSNITGINQSDISKIERGLANPSLLTLKRLAEGLGCRLKISFIPKEDTDAPDVLSQALNMFSDDYMSDECQLPSQIRESL